MGILANGYREIIGGIYQGYGATVENNAVRSAGLANFARTGANRNITAGEGITSGLVSLPSGNRHPSAWMMPQKPGALAARNTLTGAGIAASTALAVKLAAADLTGSGSLEAIGGLIVQLIADIAGSGEISDADLKAFLQAVASIGGSGGVTGAQASGLGELVAALAGLGLVDATLTGTGELSADLVVTGTGLTTGNVGQAVWAAIAASNNTAGTMGAKLNSAASGGVDYVDMADAVRTELQAELTRIIELAKIHGLVVGTDLVVTATTRAAGDIAQTISEAAGTVTVARS